LLEVEDWAEISVTAALQPAATARLISSGPDGYRFTHALVQAAVYEALPVERRAKLHRRARDALVRLDACDDERGSDLAFHSYRAAFDGDVGPARCHTLSAARRARQRPTFEDAARWVCPLARGRRTRQGLPSELLGLLFECAEAEMGSMNSERVSPKAGRGAGGLSANARTGTPS
jgi:hypothetical protein